MHIPDLDAMCQALPLEEASGLGKLVSIFSLETRPLCVYAIIVACYFDEECKSLLLGDLRKDRTSQNIYTINFCVGILQVFSFTNGDAT